MTTIVTTNSNQNSSSALKGTLVAGAIGGALGIASNYATQKYQLRHAKKYIDSYENTVKLAKKGINSFPKIFQKLINHEINMANRYLEALKQGKVCWKNIGIAGAHTAGWACLGALIFYGIKKLFSKD